VDERLRVEQGFQALWWQVLVVFAVLLGMAVNGVSQSNSKNTIVPRAAATQAQHKPDRYTTRQSAASSSDVSLEGAPDERFSATFGGSLTPDERSQVAVNRGGDNPWRQRSRVSAMTASASCGWEEGFWISDLDGAVEAMAVYDDGNGEALYVGGRFTSASGESLNHIARWDGASWSELSGPLGSVVNGTVEALAVYDDGNGEALYVGGGFTSASGVIVNHIAKWDGASWSAVSGPAGTGVSGSVRALAVYDDGSGEALYAGGYFTSAGGVRVNHIAKWDGVSWSALSGPSGTGVSDVVRALAVYDDGNGEALYAGGYFTWAGGVRVNCIARWDGVSWSALSGPSDTGVNDTVYALAAYDNGNGEALYAGGWFDSAGGVVVNGIAKWDGASWSALSGPSESGVDGSVYALAMYDDGSGDALYAGGYFTTAGGVSVIGIAKWDGVSWSDLGWNARPGVSGGVGVLAVYDDGSGAALHAGGSFTSADGVIVNGIAKWDGTLWHVHSGPSGSGVSGWVRELAVYDDGTGEALYAGGFFASAGGVIVNGIAKWDGVSWSALSGPSDTGVNILVYALAVYDDGIGAALYAGGESSSAEGVSGINLAKWDGASWSELSGLTGYVFSDAVMALAVYDDGSGEALYVGGYFNMAGGVPANGIAKWDGDSWSALSGPTGKDASSGVYALAVYDDGSGEALYVGGESWIGKWDGDSWSFLSGSNGNSVLGNVYALAVYDDGSGEALFAGGSFTSAGGEIVNHIAKWDGVSWIPLAGSASPGVSGSIGALAVYDDGSEDALYAGGSFTSAGDVLANGIAKWNGVSWSALSGPSGAGVNGMWLNALVVYDDGRGEALYVGGDFTSAGGVASSRIAKWNGETDSDSDGACDNFDRCPGLDDGADADGDGVPDGCDVCLGFDDNNDADTDGVPDGCDICPGFDDSADSDGDGTPDGCDVCPQADDGIDRDANGIPDGCEPRWIQGRH